MSHVPAFDNILVHYDYQGKAKFCDVSFICISFKIVLYNILDPNFITGIPTGGLQKQVGICLFKKRSIQLSSLKNMQNDSHSLLVEVDLAKITK